MFKPDHSVYRVQYRVAEGGVKENQPVVISSMPGPASNEDGSKSMVIDLSHARWQGSEDEHAARGIIAVYGGYQREAVELISAEPA